MIYIFYISFLLKYNTVDKKVKKGMISVETIFPREENAEHIFEKILENEDACERLRELFYEEFANSGDRDLSEKQFVKALFDAYQNRDLSAFLMGICGNSMFDLLRNAYSLMVVYGDGQRQTGTLRFRYQKDGSLKVYSYQYSQQIITAN